MTKQIILVNGPSRSGKDTVGNIIVKLLGDRASTAKFAHVLKCGTHSLYLGLHDYWAEEREQIIDLDTPRAVYDDAAYEGLKDDPLPRFFGLSPREAYIAVSEVYMKVIYGKRIFGEILAANLEQVSTDVVVVTDSGFTPEAEVLAEKYGDENVFVISLARPGTAFDPNADPAKWTEILVDCIRCGQPVKDWLCKITDSRSYIELPKSRKFHLRNDECKAVLEQNVLTALENFGL